MVHSTNKGGNLTKVFRPILYCAFLGIGLCLGGDTSAAPAESPGAQSTAGKDAANPSGIHEGEFVGPVVETMDVSEYTYVLVNSGTGKYWAAAPKFKVSVGDSVVVNGMPMVNFHSTVLNRTFDVIYFTGAILHKGDVPPSAVAGSPHGGPEGEFSHPSVEEDLPEFTGLKKASGGKTIAELFAQKDKLAGKKVTVRAGVVKAMYGIKGKSWLHLRDGTGGQGTNDITVVTTAKPAVGDVVLAKGKLTKDLSLGHGYFFPLIIEDASVSVEARK